MRGFVIRFKLSLLTSSELRLRKLADLIQKEGKKEDSMKDAMFLHETSTWEGVAFRLQ